MSSLNSRVFVNNFSTNLSSGITASDTTMTLDSIAGIENLPVKPPRDVIGGSLAYPTLGTFLTLTIEPESGAETADDYEIVHLTQIVDGGGAQSIVMSRGHDNTTAKAWNAGARVSARYTADLAQTFFYGTLTEIEDGDGRLCIKPEADNPPATNPDGTDSKAQVNISPNAVTGCYGNNSVNVGTGSAGDGEEVTAGGAGISEDVVNIGSGGVYGYGNGRGYERSVNVGRGSAGGPESFNIGSGGTGEWGINMGTGGVYNGATAPEESGINLGGQGSYELGAINIGSGGGTGPGGAGAITIGRNTSAGTGGVALGLNADASGQTNAVALGSDSTVTDGNQVNIGNRDLEAGTSASPLDRGVILYSPNKTRYKVTVDDTGTLVVTAAPLE